MPYSAAALDACAGLQWPMASAMAAGPTLEGHRRRGVCSRKPTPIAASCTFDTPALAGTAPQRLTALAGASQVRALSVEAAPASRRRGPSQPPSAAELLKSFLCGGVAGTVAKSAVAPLDRTKILFQVSHRRYTARAAAAEMKRIVLEEGPTALFKGNMATVARVLPYSGIQLMSFDQYKRIVSNARHGAAAGVPTVDALDRLLAGAMAGATSVALTYPLDLIRARLAVQVHYRHYQSLGHAFLTAYREEGPRALYRGMSPTLVGILPYGGLSFLTYDQFKAWYRDKYGSAPGVYERLGAGAVAGIVGQSFTYPLDVIRRRMQTVGFKGDGIGVKSYHATGTHPSMVATGRNILRKEGVSALFKGLTMNWIKGPIAVGISFTVFDLLKSKFGIVPISELKKE